MSVKATSPGSVKVSPRQYLRAHGEVCCRQIGGTDFRYRGAFVYVEAQPQGGATNG